MKLQEILKVLRQIAPENLAESWDRVGLQLGDPRQPIRRIMLCIDLTSAVLEEAVRRRTDLLIAYHPLIFEPLSSLRTDDPRQALVLQAARAGIAVYSPHTALDAAPGGLADWLASVFGPGSIEPIHAETADQNSHSGLPGRISTCKLVTFVPPEHADRLRHALAEAGAGVIGDYTCCSFASPGQGTFLGGASTHPTIGRPGQLERVEELRLEMLCPLSRLEQVVAALRRTHPYEEPAFDIIPLLPPPASDQPAFSPGPGRILTLRQPATLNSLAQRLRRRLGLKQLYLAAAPQTPKNKPIRRIALCPGAGYSVLRHARDVDLYFTGEMRHHDLLAANARGIHVLLAGHSQTERPYLPIYRRRILEKLPKAIPVLISRADRPPEQILP